MRRAVTKMARVIADTNPRPSVPRLIGGVVTLVVSVVAVLTFAAPSSGQASPCPPGQPPGRPPGVPPNQPGPPPGRPPAYPPGECNLALSQSAAQRGQTVHASGNGYATGETVVVTLGGQQVGTAVADSVGAFSLDFTVPADAPIGRTDVLASSASRELTAAFEVIGAAEASRGSAADERAAALSSTGTDAARLALLGVGFVLAGVVLLIVVRRRRSLPAA